MKITTIILTYNEELNIMDCIQSIQKISDRIIVVDSYSTDKTVDIAESLGAEVYQNEFVNQAKQVIYAMDNLDINSEWILRLDADERISSEASDEIIQVINRINTDVNGIVVPFEVNFLGKKLKHGGIFPFKKMIVVRNGFAKMENRQMDEHFYLLSGKSIELKAISQHKDYKDLTTWIDKHNKYSSREALDYLNTNVSLNNNVNLNTSAKINRYVKFNIYYKLPMGFRSYIYYFYRYYIKLGFLDGKEGKIFAFLQAYWYRFLVDSKIYEQMKIKDEKNEKNLY